MVRPLALLAVFALSSVTAGAAAAQTRVATPPPRPDSGLSLGFRTGYGIPMGDVGAIESGSDTAVLSDGIRGMIPLVFELGYRLNPHFYLGGSLQYGFGFVNEEKSPECDDGDQDCSINDIAFGLMGRYHVSPGAPFDFWAGLGVGYEILSINASSTEGGQKVEANADLEGFQFMVLELGGNLAASPTLSVGPFASFSMGSYSSWSANLSTGSRRMSTTGDIARTSMHQWLTMGLRGQFDF
jgi:hypothetical protein